MSEEKNARKLTREEYDQLRSEETRNKILDTALDLFKTKPFHQISTQEIADRAEVSKGSIFKHFSKKEFLLVEAMARFVDQEIGTFSPGIFDLPAEDAIKAILDIVFESAIKNPSLIHFYISSVMPVMNDDHGDPEVQKKLQELLQKMYSSSSIFTPLMEKLGYTNSFAASIVMLSAIDGLSIHLYHLGNHVPEQVISGLKQVFLQMILQGAK